MKLLYCPNCKDIVRLYYKQPRSCKCVACLGNYTGSTNVEIIGPSIILGIDDCSFDHALTQSEERQFVTFVISDSCEKGV